MPVKACPHGHGYYQARSCPECKRRENQRPSSTTRGYGEQHRKLRQGWQHHMHNHGWALCSRCGNWITDGDEWELDHSDDRTE